MLIIPPQQLSSLFPYTTLFRSVYSFTGGLDGGDPAADLKIDRNGKVDGTTDLEVRDRKSTRLNSSHMSISYAVFRLKKKLGIIKTAVLLNFLCFKHAVCYEM